MKKLKKIISKFIWIINIPLLLINIILLFGIGWLNNNFGLVSMEEIIFHLNVPIGGTSKDMISDFLNKCIFPSVAIFIIFITLFYFRYKAETIVSIRIFRIKREYKLKKIVKKIIIIFNLILIITQFNSLDKKFQISSYIKNQLTESHFIEEQYVDASKANIKFKEKRNLIFIYLESMESNFSNTTVDGQTVNLIPELESIALNNTHFSSSKGLGGAKQVSGLGWTIGAMVGYTSGVPLMLPINCNSYSGYDFMPGVYSLGDILKKNGYNQTLIVGSDSGFAGRKDYFTQHGNYKIKDIYTASKDNIIEEGYYEFWGFEDKYLFEYAKSELKELNKSKKPFNLTLLTVNTHAPDGYIEDTCDSHYNNQYANAVRCSSKQVSEFLDWIKKQDFYDNTTVIIVGDHLSMATNEILDSDNRTVYNVIINSYVKKDVSTREFATIDMFPTTLASIGATIEGDKLGLGVNLYSDRKTLIEEYGAKYVDAEIRKKSNFYNNKLLFSK